MNFSDVTSTVNKGSQKYKIIKQLYYMDEKGTLYDVDNKHVILKPTKREIEVAKLLGELYGGEIRIIPRISLPQNIKTPDYIINSEKFDLKQITGEGKYVIQGNLKGKKEQADNFVFDITNSKISKYEVMKQFEAIYDFPRYSWVNKILVLEHNQFIKIYERI